MTEHNISRHPSLPHYVCADIAGIVCQPRLQWNANKSGYPRTDCTAVGLPRKRTLGHWTLIALGFTFTVPALPVDGLVASRVATRKLTDISSILKKPPAPLARRRRL